MVMIRPARFAISVALAGSVFSGGELQGVERPYDFRTRLEVVHEPGLRDVDVKPNADEFVFADGVVVRVPPDADEVMVSAAKDFCDYLDVSMGVSARFARGDGRCRCMPSCGMRASIVDVAVDRSLLARAYRIETGDDVMVVAADSRAAAQALYHLEDLMNLLWPIETTVNRYNRISIDNDTTAVKPRWLAVGDSYYQGIKYIE